MHVERPPLSPFFQDPELTGLTRLQKLFFAPTDTSQAAGAAFIARISQRAEDRDPVSGPQVAQAQIAAFRAWEQVAGERFADLKRISQPTLVVNGVHDQMIPVRNSYWLAETLPNAVLTVYPDAGHGSLFQYHDAFARQALAFLASDTASAVS
jgi:pimeloyl-ACP methyl ester carboxylesterase